jgi:threonine dehydrogenase-like Zn-dependent dehydrogenase
MRQLVYLEPGRLAWQEADAPQIEGPREALVRPLTVAACDLDVAVVRGRAPLPGPFAFGHEGIAEVVTTGEAVTAVAPGDRVVVPAQISCGACPACAEGRSASCTSYPGTAMYGLGVTGGGWPGLLAELVRVPEADAMLVRLPEGADPVALASLSDNLPDGWRAVAPPLAQRPGAEVLVVGGGAPSVGLYAVAVARALGADVTYVDHDEDRLAAADRLGARLLPGRPPRRAGRFLITVDAANTQDGLACALRSTAPDGVCTSVSMYFADPSLPMLSMYTSGVTLQASRAHMRAAIPPLLDLVASGRLDPGRLTSQVAPWDEAPAALADVPRGLVKLVLAR